MTHDTFTRVIISIGYCFFFRRTSSSFYFLYKQAPRSLLKYDMPNISVIRGTSSLRNVCFTLFPPESADITTPDGLVNRTNTIRYMVWQEERCPSTQRLHLQGYVEFTNPAKFSVIQTLFKFPGHYEKRRGSRDQARDYCRKEDTRVRGPFEMGEWTSRQGTRSDLDEIIVAIQGGATPDDIDTTFPDQAAKFHSWILRVYQAHQKTLQSKPEIILRPWQASLYETLQAPPHGRQIMWYWDEKGGTGKTTFSRWLIHSLKKVAYFRGGRCADVAFAYNYEPVVIFDYCRDSIEYINYSTLEHFKDGMLFSAKYQSCSKIFDIPHVLVFANQEPDRSKLSSDRWDIHHIASI